MLLRMLMKEPRAGRAPLRRPGATCDTATRSRPPFSPTDASFTTLGVFKAPGAAVSPSDPRSSGLKLRWSRLTDKDPNDGAVLYTQTSRVHVQEIRKRGLDGWR